MHGLLIGDGHLSFTHLMEFDLNTVWILLQSLFLFPTFLVYQDQDFFTNQRERGKCGIFTESKRIIINRIYTEYQKFIFNTITI